MSLTQINKAGLDEIALDHVFTVGASGTNHYTFQGEGLNGTVNDPTLYLTRGKTYRFEKGSAPPLRIQSTQGASGTAYNTGVTNNGGTGTVIIEVQHDAPDVLYYQCTSDPAMNGVLYITGALADGGVTTAKISNSAVSTAKIADDAVTTAKINNSAVTTAKIADQAVTLAKLPHGTPSNDGKFLRANNGADPSFETVSIPAGTTINNNADNRLITGSGTANTLNGESTLTYDGTTLGLKANDARITIEDNTNGTVNSAFRIIPFNGVNYIQSGTDLTHNSASTLAFSTIGGGTEWGRFDSSGRLLLGTTVEGHASADNLTINDSANSGLTIRSGSSNVGTILFSDATSGAGEYAGYLDYAHNDNRMTFGTNGAERMRIDSAGNVGVGTQSPLKKLDVNGDIKASSIYLGGTGTDNQLDEYEEGSWTPALVNTSNTPVHANAQGKYTKIGRLVNLGGLIQAGSTMPTFSNLSDILQISGIPFAPGGTGYRRAVGTVQWQTTDWYDTNSNIYNYNEGQITCGFNGNYLSFWIARASHNAAIFLISYATNRTFHNQGFLVEWNITYMT